MSETTENYVCPMRAARNEVEYLYAKGTIPKGSGVKILKWLNAGIEEKQELLEAFKETLRVLVAPQGFPDKGKGRTDEQQAAYDNARKAIAKAERRQS